MTAIRQGDRASQIPLWVVSGYPTRYRSDSVISSPTKASFQIPPKLLCTTTPQASPKTITRLIRYENDPFKKDQFTAYADNWARIIPRLGRHLLGYFVPHEGSNYEAWGVFYIARVAALTPLGRKNLADLLPTVNSL